MTQDTLARFLEVLETGTGKPHWRYRLADGNDVSFDAADGIVPLSAWQSDPGRVTSVDNDHAVRIATGETVWRYPIGLKGLVSDVEISGRGDIVYVAAAGGVMEAETAGSTGRVRLFAIPK